MSLAARNRSALFEGLSTVVPEPEAVEEMLANFAARKDEEWVSREFVRAELASLRSDVMADVATLRLELHTEILALRTEVHTEIGALRTEVHTEIGALRTEVHAGTQRLIMWMVGTNISLFVLLFALLRLTA